AVAPQPVQRPLVPQKPGEALVAEVAALLGGLPAVQEFLAALTKAAGRPTAKAPSTRDEKPTGDTTGDTAGDAALVQAVSEVVARLLPVPAFVVALATTGQVQPHPQAEAPTEGAPATVQLGQSTKALAAPSAVPVAAPASVPLTAPATMPATMPAS